MDGALGAHLPAVGPDRLDEPARNHLPPALGIAGAAQEVIGEPGRHCDRCVGGAHRVAALLAQDHRGGAMREPFLGEEFGHRPQPPLQEARRFFRDIFHGDLFALQVAPGPSHILHHVEDRRERIALGRECLEQPGPVAIPTEWNPEREIREVQGGVAIRIERTEHHALGEAQSPENRRDHTVAAALADVMDAYVELVLATLVLAPEHLGVATRHVVRFQNQGAPTGGAEICGRRQPAESRSDYNGVPALAFVTLDIGHTILRSHSVHQERAACHASVRRVHPALRGLEVRARFQCQTLPEAA